MKFLSPRGRATFAWQSDYGQFYLIDRDDVAFDPAAEFTSEIETRRVAALPSGLVVYTNDSLQQQIRIAIYDEEPDASPVEPFGGKPWTQTEELQAEFPSKSFTLSSPSHPHPLPLGPVFYLDVTTVKARICWMEFQGSRDDSIPVEPDVIEVHLWSARRD